ncbi:S1 family peptidase [Actinotalea sp. C106]|uniref:S1 family peptidase n=1 Tax=Actinotalea sp. C106 TaxID=2908644 RepID=UPI002027EB67|nr:S1 family peptidase [Actinotalea sp. C106]
MDLQEARQRKSELASFIGEVLDRRATASRVEPASADSPAALRAGVSLGLAPQPDGGFGVAVRYRLGVPTARMVVRRVTEHVGPGVDVRRTGRISPAAARPGPRPPVITAQAVGETGRSRPLRPGVSIAHVHVSAGTLGGFVRVDGVLHALSNYHVLVGSPQGITGDVVLQPGPADGGRDPQDRIGALAGFVALEPGSRALVDAALASLEAPEVDLRFPVGAVSTTAVALGGEEVEKIGRTTGITQGRVTAIELDDVVVGYGPGLGDISLDNQIEVEGTGVGPFSRGGDSGSLVYRRPDGAALGLLFAGSETGGENGTGLTYLNPIDAVLEALGAELAG